jgi:hypothetical protein
MLDPTLDQRYHHHLLAKIQRDRYQYSSNGPCLNLPTVMQYQYSTGSSRIGAYNPEGQVLYLLTHPFPQRRHARATSLFLDLKSPTLIYLCLKDRQDWYRNLHVSELRCFVKGAEESIGGKRTKKEIRLLKVQCGHLQDLMWPSTMWLDLLRRKLAQNSLLLRY